MKNRIYKLLEIQKQINDIVGIVPSVTQYKYAILAELGEAMESTGYKWWKKTKIDTENLKTEIIDILHFILSITLKNNQENKFINFFTRAFNTDFKKNEDIKDLLLSLAETINSDLIYYNIGLAIKNLMSFDELYERFVIKATLNIFRQKNGYQTGVYEKNINGIEDNTAILRIAKNIEKDENFAVNLYKEFEKYYKENKEKK